jgi:pyruvate/oxaloacetate carboxyltransferase
MSTEVKTTDTVLRDAHQCLLTTHMRTEAILNAKRDAGPPGEGGRSLI